ncbi:MAG: SUMF1/EgtB/PvdO family nonheme iron enzyme, partial [Pseudomonadota bacterium]|nr:SUMF1/EgtB/PvdO family nonheme iron enzyme [Pseudomonadota bacterium]
MRFSIIALVMCSPTCYSSSEMQLINGFLIDRTEISIAEFQRFASATEFVSQAERAGGGEVYAWGWEQKPGWTWKTPFGVESDPQLPAVYLTFDEAAAYCQWRGARLPSEAEWREAAY